MASLANDPGGRRRIQFIGSDGRRRTIRLGRVPVKLAEAFKLRIESIVAAQCAGLPLDSDAARWIGTLSPDLADKLAAAALIPPRKRSTLGAFTAGYIAGLDVKASTKVSLGLARARLITYYGDRPLSALSDAEGFAAWLLITYARATAGRTIGRAKQFCAAAVKGGLIERNPFADLKGLSQHNNDRKRFIDRPTIDRVLDHCYGEWPLIVALCRFGGLRCPSEVVGLRWSDVKADRFWVRSPKTEHHEGREGRWVPLFPELKAFMGEGSGNSGPVITRPAGNWGTTFAKIVRRAGFEPWPRLFHNLRASRETELAADYPLHVAAEWLGNTALVAARHYLTVREDDFARASHQAAQQPAAAAHQNVQRPATFEQSPADLPDDSRGCGPLRVSADDSDGLGGAGTGDVSSPKTLPFPQRVSPAASLAELLHIARYLRPNRLRQLLTYARSLTPTSAGGAA